MAWHDGPKERNHPDVTAFIAACEPKQQAILNTVRERLKQDPDILEFIAWGVPCYWRKGPLVYTSPAKGHVTLGFFRGMEIGMGLKGTGKSPVAKYVWKLGEGEPSALESWFAAAVGVDDDGE